jgi:aryl-alcohol dehydrogenase-like predicted oxidoreductase
MKRRTFLQSTAAGAAVTAAHGVSGQTDQASAVSSSAPQPNLDGTVGSLDPRMLLRVSDPGERHGDMLYRPLGSTGEKVSVIGLGGSHIGKPPVDAQMAVKLIHAALERGINFLDNSWDYSGGQSELRMGKALSEGNYREKAFLMTKIDGRTKVSAKQQLDESLQRLKADHIDLVQFHEILRFEDPDRIFAKDGALEALTEAKQAGKIRYIGFTGHKDPRIHLYMLAIADRHGFHFDTVQMPLNVMDAHFRSFAHLVLPELMKRQIGVLGMKTFGDGVILKSGVPLKPIDYLHYSLNLPTSVVITGIDNEKVLDQAFEATRTFRPMNADQVAALVAQTRDYAMEGKFELFKTSNYFDTTAKHPDYLGGLTPSVEDLAPGPAT